MTQIFETIIFSSVRVFFQSLWADTAGRIFVTTFLAYSASYMLYSGYISWFAGGYGGLLLSQVGFTAIDFLALIPTSVLLLFESIRASIWPALKFIAIYLISPLVLLLLLTSTSESWQTHFIPQNSTVTLIGFILVFAGLVLRLSLTKKIKFKFQIAISLVLIGIILISFFIPLDLNTSTSHPTITTTTAIEKFDLGLEMVAFTLLFTIAMSPSLVGLNMAQFAVKEKLLSRLTRIVLKHSIQVPGMQLIKSEINKAPSTGFEGFFALFNHQKKVEPSYFEYEGDANLPVYLIASFSRVTALYISPEILQSERGKMIMLANGLIYSMEVEGRKKS
jgi:hypothetical protein